MDFCQLLKDYGQGSEIAHKYRESSMSYKELDEKSDALAEYLIYSYNEDKTPILVYICPTYYFFRIFLVINTF